MGLNAIIQRLAHTHLEHIRVTDRITGIPETVTHERRPLYADLADAKTGSISQRAGRTKPGPKVPDMSPHELEAHIRRELVADLGRMQAVEYRYELAPLTIDWLAEFRLTGPTAAEEAAWIEQFQAWEQRIRDFVEPPKDMPCIGMVCPLCGRDRFLDGDEDMAAMSIRYHEDRPVESMQLVCKRCGVLGEGVAAGMEILKVRKLTG